MSDYGGVVNLRRTVLWFLLLCLLLVPQYGLAKSIKTEITGVRSGVFNDPATGEAVMRYVFDVSAPVVVTTSLVPSSNSAKLNILFKQAAPNAAAKFVVKDKLVKGLKVVNQADGTQVVFDVKRKLSAQDYRVFTLAANAEDKKGYRVVVDIFQTTPAVTPAPKPETFTRQELINLRSDVHVDAVSGNRKLRLVLDATGPVKPVARLESTPLPRLVIDLAEVDAKQLAKDYEFDGKIVDRVLIESGGSNAAPSSRLIINLPYVALAEGYKLFVLQADPELELPFRIVIDIDQVLPPVTYTAKPGLKDKVIVIDPGHGGSDPGAIGAQGLQEKTVNLAVALKTQALLEKAGAKVIMTRTSDVDVYKPNSTAADELKARSTIANNNKADVFVSIHSNAAGNREAGGTSTYYYRKTDYDTLLATTVQQSLLQAGKRFDRKANAANFYVNKRTLMPAVLVEMAFLTNAEEERLLGDPKFQQKMAQGIVDGLDNFFFQVSRQGGGGK